MDWFLYDIGLRRERVNPLTTNVPHHIETSQLISSAIILALYLKQNLEKFPQLSDFLLLSLLLISPGITIPVIKY